LSLPLVFISYAHEDEPEAAGAETRWYSLVRGFLRAGEQRGLFEVYGDRDMMIGEDWDTRLQEKLNACDIFVLLASQASLTSPYILETELRIVRERRKLGPSPYFCPLLISTLSKAAMSHINDLNIHPRDLRPLLAFDEHGRKEQLAAFATEIERLAASSTAPRAPTAPPPGAAAPSIPSAPYLAIGELLEIKKIRPIKRDLADISHLAGNGMPQPADQAFGLTFKLCINPIETGRSGFIGILKATLYVEFISRNQAYICRSATLPVIPGVVMKLRGLDDKWIALDVKSSGPSSIILDGDAEALRIGELIGASPGDSYRVRLEVDADTGFYSEWPPELGEIFLENETEEKRVARKKRKLIGQLRKWQKNIPADAIEIDMVVQNWRVMSEPI